MGNTDAFYSFWRDWFAQPMEAKEPFRRVKSATENRGNWYPPFSEAPGFTGKPDPKEYFHWTLKDSRSDSWLPTCINHQTVDVFWDCFDKARDWCDARGLSVLPDTVNASDCVLRILHYLPTPDGLAGEVHRDYDLLTVNVGGTCPGLEVYGRNGNCRYHPRGCDSWSLREGGIHVGEMLEIYTARRALPGVRGNEIATPHRVRIPPNTERFAAVFFYLPLMDFELRPGLTARQYLADAMRRAGTDRGAKPNG